MFEHVRDRHAARCKRMNERNFPA